MADKSNLNAKKPFYKNGKLILIFFLVFLALLASLYIYFSVGKLHITEKSTLDSYQNEYKQTCFHELPSRAIKITEHFYKLNNFIYIKDKTEIDTMGTVLEKVFSISYCRLDNINTKTFKVKSDIYVLDKNFVYFFDKDMPNIKVINEADVNTFGALDECGKYAKDKGSVYYQNEKLLLADPDTFEVVSCPYYAKDKDYVYWENKVTTGADRDTFQAIGEVPRFAKDKYNFFDGKTGRILEEDPQYNYVDYFTKNKK